MLTNYRIIGKLREFQDIMNTYNRSSIRLISRDIDLPEIQGEIVEISKAKCDLAISQIDGSVLIEDTSLCFNALRGLPGPYVKWFLSKIGNVGLTNLLAAYDDKSAVAVCAISYRDSSKSETVTFLGEINGTIVPHRGDAGFGWDSIFIPDGSDVTLAQMTQDAKNEISHRRCAIRQLCEYINKSD